MSPCPACCSGRNVAAETPDDTVAHPESETGPLAHPFRREERLEDLRQMLGRDACAVIGDRHPDQLIIAFEFGRDRPRSSLQGIDGIQEDIDEDLRDLIGHEATAAGSDGGRACRT